MPSNSPKLVLLVKMLVVDSALFWPLPLYKNLLWILLKQNCFSYVIPILRISVHGFCSRYTKVWLRHRLCSKRCCLWALLFASSPWGKVKLYSEYLDQASAKTWTQILQFELAAHPSWRSQNFPKSNSVAQGQGVLCTALLLRKDISSQVPLLKCRLPLETLKAWVRMDCGYLDKPKRKTGSS